MTQSHLHPLTNKSQRKQINLADCSFIQSSEMSSGQYYQSHYCQPPMLISSSAINNTKRMIIFDWDDTLFPTTAIIKNKSEICLIQLYNLGFKLYQLLNKYILTFGSNNIYIITNGKNGWIKQSLNIISKKFKQLLICQQQQQQQEKQEEENKNNNDCGLIECNPFEAILGLLAFFGIYCISAQYLYCKQFRNDTRKWKELAFKNCANIHFGMSLFPTNIIISIGDSDDEYSASKKCVDNLNNINGKNINTDYNYKQFHVQRIKLQRKPSLDILISEWDDLIFIIDQLQKETTSKDIKIGKEYEKMK